MLVVRARFFALLAALLLLLPSGALARAQYYCPMMGLVVASCCNETESVAQGTSPGQKLQVADCCQRLSASSRGASLGTREAFAEISPALVSTPVALFVEPGPSCDPSSSCSESTQAPLAIGPPLFVVHCALLS